MKLSPMITTISKRGYSIMITDKWLRINDKRTDEQWAYDLREHSVAHYLEYFLTNIEGK